MTSKNNARINKAEKDIMLLSKHSLISKERYCLSQSQQKVAKVSVDDKMSKHYNKILRTCQYSYREVENNLLGGVCCDSEPPETGVEVEMLTPVESQTAALSHLRVPTALAPV